MTAELAARRTAAAAVLADYNALPEHDEQWTTWAIWSERLAFHLQSLLYAGPVTPAAEPELAVARAGGSTGHPFARPGNPFAEQDACALCGEPESTHGGAELAARMTAAQAVLAEFQRSSAYSPDGAPAADWMTWALRLGQHLQQVLAALFAPPSATAQPGPLEQLGAAAVVRQMEQIRLVLDQVFGDELADRQYALEEIDEILRGSGRD